MRYIVTNFAYGTGPYLRTTELAIAVNNRFQELGKERLGIVVPLVYGEKQKRVMQEEFREHQKLFPGEILLDEALGDVLRGVFYGDNTYEDALRLWVENGDLKNHEAEKHLNGLLALFDLDGNPFSVRGQEIAMELNRAPRISYHVAPSYYTTFGYISEILERVLGVSEADISVDRRLVKEAALRASALEQEQVMHFLAEPGTFSFLPHRTARYPTEILSPPISRPPRPNTDAIAEGIYVTITGIPGLERLYGEAQKLGLRLYSNDSDAVRGSEKLLPHVVPNPNIKLQFARSGWGSVWLSMLSGAPFVAPAFDPADDPEIYFNNICIEKLGLGIMYRGQPLADLLLEAERLRPGILRFREMLMAKFGTFDGNAYSAERIVAKHLSR